MLTLNVEHNYICSYYKEFTTTTCFGPICGPSSGCGQTYSLGYTTKQKCRNSDTQKYGRKTQDREGRTWIHVLSEYHHHQKQQPCDKASKHTFSSPFHVFSRTADPHHRKLQVADKKQRVTIHQRDWHTPPKIRPHHTGKSYSQNNDQPQLSSICTPLVNT